MTVIEMAAPVAREALLRRLERRLNARGEVLRAARGVQARRRLGDWFVVAGGAVIRDHVDVEQLAREIGALQSWECIA